MKTSTKRILSIVLAGLFFVGILVVYTSLVRPELAKIGEHRALLVSKEILFNNESNAVSQVENLLGQFQNLAELQDTVSLALPLDANVTGALNQVQSIARLSNVSVSSFAVKPLAFAASKDPLVKRMGSFELNLAVSGSYDNLKTFIKSVETNVRVMNVSSMRLTQAATGDNLNLALTVEVYYQEE